MVFIMHVPSYSGSRPKLLSPISGLITDYMPGVMKTFPEGEWGMIFVCISPPVGGSKNSECRSMFQDDTQGVLGIVFN